MAARSARWGRVAAVVSRRATPTLDNRNALFLRIPYATFTPPSRDCPALWRVQESGMLGLESRLWRHEGECPEGQQ
jgi:hypothetical protein